MKHSVVTARSLFNANNVNFVLDLSTNPNEESVSLAGCLCLDGPGQQCAN